MPQDLTPPDPSIVLELLEAFRCSKVMFAGVSLGIFDSLVEQPKSAAVLAAELPADLDALTRLLDANVGLGLLARDGEAYANTPTARTYLCRDSHSRISGYVNLSNDYLWYLWGKLEDAVREGTHRWKQAFGWEGAIFDNFFKTDEAKREFLMGMHGYGLISSPLVVAAFDLGRFRRLVDLGGATGHLVEAACRRYAHLEGVLFDLPIAVPLAREIIGRSPVASRIEIIEGDFFRDPLPPADLFALGRILHDWTEEKAVKLLRRIYEHLPAGGGVLLAEKLLLEDKTGPQWAHLQSLSMLVGTEGKERTLSEYEAILTKAGFADVRGVRTNSPLDAVLALKAV